MLHSRRTTESRVSSWLSFFFEFRWNINPLRSKNPFAWHSLQTITFKFEYVIHLYLRPFPCREFCERHDMTIVSDEVHSQLILDEVKLQAATHHISHHTTRVVLWTYFFILRLFCGDLPFLPLYISGCTASTYGLRGWWGIFSTYHNPWRTFKDIQYCRSMHLLCPSFNMHLHPLYIMYLEKWYFLIPFCLVETPAHAATLM